jgi:hypothetical protein
VISTTGVKRLRYPFSPHFSGFSKCDLKERIATQKLNRAGGQFMLPDIQRKPALREMVTFEMSGGP